MTVGGDVVDVVAPDPASAPLLERVCRRAIGDLDVDSIGVSMLIGHRNLTPAYATDPRTEQLEHETVLLGEGPSLDTIATHAPVITGDLHATDASATWPMWTRAALAAGVRAAACFPIQQGAVVAGTLALYCDAPQRFDADLRLQAFRLADTALIVLLDIAAGVAGDSAESPTSQVFRPQMHRAAGMVMVQAGVSIDEATVLMRAWSFRHEQTLADVADRIVNRTLRFEPDGTASQ